MKISGATTRSPLIWYASSSATHLVMLVSSPSDVATLKQVLSRQKKMTGAVSGICSITSFRSGKMAATLSLESFQTPLASLKMSIPRLARASAVFFALEPPIVRDPEIKSGFLTVFSFIDGLLADLEKSGFSSSPVKKTGPDPDQNFLWKNW